MTTTKFIVAKPNDEGAFDLSEPTSEIEGDFDEGSGTPKEGSRFCYGGTTDLFEDGRDEHRGAVFERTGHLLHTIELRVGVDTTVEFVCAALNAADAREKESSL